MDIWSSTQDMLSTLKYMTEEERIDHQYIAKSVRDVARKHYHDSIAKDVARNQEYYHDFAEREKIIEWYSPLNFFLRQVDIFSTRQPGTGEWLLNDKKFEPGDLAGQEKYCGVEENVRVSYCAFDCATLNGRCAAGSGKLTLLEKLRAEENARVAAIYLNHKETAAQSPGRANIERPRFLLAKLHIDSLTTKHTVKAVQDANQQAGCGSQQPVTWI
ncbi:hypothetical protein FB451DRAFT_1281706 [Mycena latifolia]|nr:hypothetical protein FB451DRAFT_1281706 [Mycena latifolia]